MGQVPEPPEGYNQPQEYKLPKWATILSTIVLGIIFFVVSIVFEFQFILLNDLSTLSGALFGVVGSVFMHESAHYVVTDYVGYEPEYVWPNRVEYGVDILRTKPTVVSLLAPQILSGVYIALIYISITPGVELVFVWALGMNLVGGLKDIPWAIRRLTWPTGTVFISNEDQGYVSFPKE